MQEYQMPLKVIGMDGCPPHWSHQDAVTLRLQWDISDLHLNELLWWRILAAVDGGTSGPIGSHLHEDVWTKAV